MKTCNFFQGKAYSNQPTLPLWIGFLQLMPVLSVKTIFASKTKKGTSLSERG
jgi:hypothetical protein